MEEETARGSEPATSMKTAVQNGIIFMSRVPEAKSREERRQFLGAAGLHFRKAVRMASQSAEAWMHLALFHETLGHKWRAVRAFRKAAQFSPDRPEAHYNLAMAYYRRKRYRKALIAVNKVSQLGVWDDHEATYQNGRGRILQTLGYNDAAMINLHNALVLDPEHPGFKADYALALTQAGRFKEALPLLRETQDALPRRIDILVHLGQAEEGLGYYEQAMGKYKIALRQIRQDGLADEFYVSRRIRNLTRALKKGSAYTDWSPG